MRGTHFVVDIQTVGAAANGNHLSTQLMKHLGRDVIRRAMCCIDHDLQTFEREVIREGTFAKLDVTACSIIQTLGLAKVG